MAYTTIDEPTDYFRIKLYAGNAGANRAITWDETDTNMQPDMLWFKSRTDTQSHCLFDSVRGAVLRLIPNSAGAEGTENTNLDSFDTNGFQVDAEAIVNGSSRNYVTWGWKAGTSFTNDASSTSVGSIDSAGSVNTDAGFSIISYTGTGSNGTIAHGLGAKPDMILIKNRSNGQQWSSYWSPLGATKYMRFATTNAVATASNRFANTEPTTSVFTVSTDGEVNENNTNLIAYCFTNIQGYSKIGSYIGNGNADGPFIYTGFQPAWVMVKRTDSTGDWAIMDTARNPFNVINNYLKAQGNDAESTDASFDIDAVSNGFKVRYTNSNYNGNGGSYIYMAFAKNPFVNSEGVPGNAR